MKEKQFFVYLTTNLINGKKYVGEHASNNFNQDPYLGSGKLILYAIKKYKKKNFDRKILEQFNSRKEAFEVQEKYINEYNTLIPYGYNISPKGGHEISGGLSEVTKEKIRKTLRGKYKDKIFSKEYREKLRQARIGKHPSKETRKKQSEAKKGKPSGRKGKFHSEETKLKISLKCKGYKHTEETKAKFKNRIPWNKSLKLK